jgi:apolipoprotein N-acyltransferase
MAAIVVGVAVSVWLLLDRRYFLSVVVGFFLLLIAAELGFYFVTRARLHRVMRERPGQQ